MRELEARKTRFESHNAPEAENAAAVTVAATTVVATVLAATTVATVGMAIAAFPPFFILRPNRIALGRAIGLIDAEPIFLAAIAVSWVAYVFATARSRSRAAAGSAVAIAALGLGAVGVAASRLVGGDAIARLSLGSGFWLLELAAYAAFVVALRNGRVPVAARRSWAFASALGIVLLVVLLMTTGSLDALSIMREWKTQRTAFASELRRHLALTAGSVFAGGLVGLAIGGAAARGKAARSAGFFFLNIFQTIPSLALFGLLILPLAALSARFPLLRSWGISGIGAAPALIALSLYAALPIARNTYSGLEGVPAAALDAGRGMGMGKAQLFLRVELPLALPVIVAGFRTATVQAIGNVAIAALIGAGGMGTFIFQGLGQFAMDMVLMGTLPVIALALVADAAFASLARAVTPRGLLAAAPAGAAP